MAVDFFEEFRYIVELIAAEQILIWIFAKKKPHFTLIYILGLLFLVPLAMSYVFISGYVETFQMAYFSKFIDVSWYIFLMILTLLYLKLHYEVTWSDLLFVGVGGYCMQHIEYVMVNEVLALGLWKDIRNSLLLYTFVCVVTTALLYYLIAKIYVKKLRAGNGVLFEDHASTIFFFVFMLGMLLFTAFLGQHLFANGSDDFNDINYLGALYDCLSSILILVLQYNMLRISNLSKEKEIVKQLLYERQKQYQLSKENIEMINHKCHDLKYQINALRMASKEEMEDYFNEVEESIMFYNSVVKTDNEVLNTILSEKSLYCEKHQIKLSCIIDVGQLDFIGTQDLYALLGNILDNAIECVIRHKDKEQRVISLTISANESFLSIQSNNFVEEELTFDHGLPITTKRRKDIHGFGMKSIKHLAEKYKGTMYAEVKDHIFTLQILLPIPKEYIRLLKEFQKKSQIVS